MPPHCSIFSKELCQEGLPSLCVVLCVLRLARHELSAMKQSIYIAGNCRKPELSGYLFEEYNDDIVPGIEGREVKANRFSDKSLDAVAVNGARHRLLADDNGEAALLERICERNERKKASISLFTETKHAVYVLMIG